MKTVGDYMNEYGLVLIPDSGKEIKRPKGLYSHTGIIMGKHKYTHKIMVFHNHPDTGAALVTMEVFKSGQNVQYTNRLSHPRSTVLMRSFRQIKYTNSYHLTNYNCQHASSYSVQGKSSSAGKDNTIATVLVSAALLILFGGGGSDSNKSV